MAVDVWTLKRGDVVRLESGTTARVAGSTEDGRWILVRYLEVPDDPDLVGTNDLCSEDEIMGLATSPVEQPGPEYRR